MDYTYEELHLDCELETEQEIEVSPIDIQKILTEIWTAPKQTIEYIIANHQGLWVSRLMFLSGVFTILNRGVSERSLELYPFLSVLIGAAIVMGFFKIFMLELFAIILAATGRWLGGNGNSSEMRTVAAWFALPIFFGVLLLIPEYFVLGKMTFIRGVEPEVSFIGHMFLNLLDLVRFGLFIYSLVILVLGISIVQGFGMGKSILNVLLPFGILFAVIVCIGFVVYLFSIPWMPV